MELSSIEATWQEITSDAFGRPGSPSFHVPGDVGSRGVIVLNAHLRITHANDGISVLLGIASQDLLGKDGIAALCEPLKLRLADPEGYESRWNWLRDNPLETVEDVVEVILPESRVLHRYSAPLFNAEGGYTGRVEIYSDITRRRALEGAVQRAYEELKETQEQLVQSEKLRAVGEIASGVAHDFNNILGIVLGNIQLLMRTVDDENVRSKLSHAERAALDGVETVRRIREFTKTRPRRQPDVLDLSVLAADVAQMMEPVWKDAIQAWGGRVDIRFDFADCALAKGVGAEIREVLANILLNAVQAMPEGGLLTISTGCDGAASWMRVADTGAGMTEDVRKRVFDPFFTTRGVEGTGLGMSVAYGIVRRHDGSLSIESEPGRGTAVTVSLPVGDEKDQQELCELENKPVAIDPARILVVDDEEMFANVFVEMLSECGHSVCVARNGNDALEQFRSGEFDLVITDLGMPEMSGRQLAESIKEIDSRTPVVLLTGWGVASENRDTDDSVVDMVLSKPVEMEHLSSIVADALGRRASDG